MKRKLILIMLLLLFTIPCLRGQRKEMSQARSYIKSGKDFDKAEKLMEELLSKDSLNQMNPKIYLLLYQSVLKQYEAGNEKLYLKQQYDTASLFDLTKRMFDIVESLDSVDALPNKNGKIKLEYRNKHAMELDAYRPNLYYGGTFNIHKCDYNKAYSFFDTYLDCGNQPLFTNFNYWKNDPKMQDAAFWATYCGYKLNNPKYILKYWDVTMADTAKHKSTLIYISHAYKLLGEKEKYVSILSQGFLKYPTVPYFFSHLFDYYIMGNRLDSALTITNRALKYDGKNPLFLYAKSSVLLNMGNYDGCIQVGDSLIQINDTLAEVYYNVGTAYLNKGIYCESDKKLRKNREQIRHYYQQALPYMEKYRELAPTENRKWGPALYKIYLILNMGKQFEEIDNYLKDN